MPRTIYDGVIDDNGKLHRIHAVRNEIWEGTTDHMVVWTEHSGALEALAKHFTEATPGVLNHAVRREGPPNGATFDSWTRSDEVTVEWLEEVLQAHGFEVYANPFAQDRAFLHGKILGAAEPVAVRWDSIAAIVPGAMYGFDTPVFAVHLKGGDDVPVVGDVRLAILAWTSIIHEQLEREA